MFITGKSFTEIFVAACVILVLASLTLVRGLKEKQDFKSSKGSITYIDSTYKHYPYRHHGKFRYIIVDSYPYAFEIFIGKDWDEFGPKYEQIDSLRVGDIITVYYDEVKETKEDRLNRLVQFIDKENTPIFVKGSTDIGMGIFLLIISIGIGAVSYYFYKRGGLED